MNDKLDQLKKQVLSNKIDNTENEEFIEEEFVTEMAIAAYPAMLSHTGEPINDPSNSQGKVRVLFKRNENKELEKLYVSINNSIQNVNESYEMTDMSIEPINEEDIPLMSVNDKEYVIPTGYKDCSVKNNLTKLLDTIINSDRSIIEKYSVKKTDQEEYTKVNHLLKLLNHINIGIIEGNIDNYVINEDWFGNSDIVYEITELKMDDTTFTEPTKVDYSSYNNDTESVKQSKLNLLKEVFARNCPDKYEYIDQVERDNVKHIFGFKTTSESVIRAYTNYLAFILFKYILGYDAKLLLFTYPNEDDDFELVPYYHSVDNDENSSYNRAEFNMFNYEEGSASMRTYDSMEHMIEDTLGSYREHVKAFILKDLPESVWQYDIIPGRPNSLMRDLLNRLLSDENLFVSINSLKEDVDMIVNEAVNIADVRKKVMDKITKVYTYLDRTGENLNYQLGYWNSMSDVKFMKEMKAFLNDEKANFTLEVLPNKNEPSLKDIKDALKSIGVPENEYVYFPHLGGIRTKHKVPVGYVHIKRLQQILSKKNTYTLDISKRNAKTGQVTGESQIARISDLETTALTAIGAESALKEFLGPRADDSRAKNKMYADIGNFGYVSQADIPNSLEEKQTLNTVSDYLTAAGLDNDLLTDNRVLELIKTLV